MMPYISPPRNALISRSSSVEKSMPGAPAISVGDLLEATIVKNLGGDQLLIRLNGSDTIRAESAALLRAGETVTVKVEETRPLVVLSLVDSAAWEPEPVTELLRFQRSHPGALLSMISELPEALESKSFASFFSLLSKENVQTIIKLLEAIQLSAKTAQNPLFFKNYVENLGLLWESSLKKALRDGGIEPGRAGLKGALLKLSEELSALSANKDIGADALVRLDALRKMTAGSIRTIESEQVMNVLYQENENRYLFQVPFLLASGPRMADISLEFEGKGNKEGQGGFRVLFLLEMDALGDVCVETSIKTRHLSCRIRCTDPDACRFISSQLHRLENGLTGLGFRIDSMLCRFEADLTDERENFTQARMGGGREVVNVFA
ncbi:MAG: Flagellar hook-length control protein FliK [Candidatus Omnitrophica bacterium ADurb.Bin277]|nr:MAG: Flagellar hook-length control protein FliK [Candidatus Omnitrophica bacterium ADurb.Bin277]